jgi:cytochrome c oxidase assembly protein subunit 15
LTLLLTQIYFGALVAGLRAGHAYNSWPLIDGAFVPHSSRLLFDVPLWRNFFENPLTVQFDHRMLGYAIGLLALLHLFNVARLGMRGPIFTSAALVAAAVIVQTALGIWTLLSVAALPLALLHQATGMMTLTLAIIHTATTVPRQSLGVNRTVFTETRLKTSATQKGTAKTIQSRGPGSSSKQT